MNDAIEVSGPDLVAYLNQTNMSGGLLDTHLETDTKRTCVQKRLEYMLKIFYIF